MSLYAKRGVSAQKEEVHAATRSLDQGLFPNAFCKMYPDFLGNDANWINVIHADGAGTKSILAYLYWKETGDVSVWKGIAEDAIVMNLDDLLCVGICDNMIFSSTIDRNKHLIPGEVLQAIIEGSRELFDRLLAYGIHIHYLGGETADVGDVVRTIAVNGTLAARWPKNRVISNSKIREGDVIVGLAGFGQANYESTYNSGLGSNGLTSARHDMLHNYYATAFPESLDPGTDPAVAYIGPYRMTDLIREPDLPEDISVGKLVLSPTRTFAPVLKPLLDEHFEEIHGLVHCSGGGQTKCMKYLPAPFSILKDQLFPTPPVFRLIQQHSGASWKEMYEVFNMGCRMEVFCRPEFAHTVIEYAKRVGVDARVTGNVLLEKQQQLRINHPGADTLVYSYS